MKLKDKVAVITGASVGIGRGTAIKFAEEGARLALIDMNRETLDVTASELEQYGVEVACYTCDISNEDAVYACFDEIKARFGQVDILVNNAAIWRSSKLFTELPTEEWRLFLNVNVMGTVYCTKAVIDGMLERGWGRIINVASVAGVYGNAKMSHYSATKGAIISFTKALAKEVTARGVLVNAVSPGSVSSSADRDPNASTPGELCFMGRSGTHMENANLIAFLASDDASYIAGQNIQIDGCRKKQ